MGGWEDGQVDVWVDGWDGWMDEQTDKWVNGYFSGIKSASVVEPTYI